MPGPPAARVFVRMATDTKLTTPASGLRRPRSPGSMTARRLSAGGSRLACGRHADFTAHRLLGSMRIWKAHLHIPLLDDRGRPSLGVAGSQGAHRARVVLRRPLAWTPTGRAQDLRLLGVRRRQPPMGSDPAACVRHIGCERRAQRVLPARVPDDRRGRRSSCCGRWASPPPTAYSRRGWSSPPCRPSCAARRDLFLGNYFAVPARQAGSCCASCSASRCCDLAPGCGTNALAQPGLRRHGRGRCSRRRIDALLRASSRSCSRVRRRFCAWSPPGSCVLRCPA